MKHTLPILCLLTATGLSTKAQITVTKADLVTTQVYTKTAKDTSSFINPGAAGANQTWDYSSLMLNKIDSGLSAVPGVFTPNPLFPYANQSSCTSMPNISICTYLSISDTGFYFAGAEQNLNIGYTSNQIVKTNVPALVYRFPITYNQNLTQSYIQQQMAVNSSPSPNDSVRIVYYRTNSFLVDGWGTLKTPLGTFTTLRMKKIASNLDTTYNHPVGGNWIRGQVNGLKYDTSYSWLANGLFEVASMSKYSPGIYRYSFYNNRPATTGLSNAEQSTTHFSVYPNPVSDVLNLDYQGNKVSLSITNAMGQDCGLNTNTHSIDVSGLNPGIYLIHIQSEDGKHLIQKFIKM